MNTIKKLADAPWLHMNATQRVFRALNRDGYEVRVVGGAIRNTLLQKPVKDIDIATTAPPDITIRHAQDANLKVIPTGLKHGTVTVIADNVPYEVTTLRLDVETDGRRAIVAFTHNWLADASRRDFTMNALYVNANGELYDPLNGYEDLMEKKVRFIGQAVERIREDYLRILRYFRFKAEYGLDTLDFSSLHACVQEKNGLRQLSSERISTELFRLLEAPAALSVVELMFKYGLLVDLLGSTVHPQALRKLCGLDRMLKYRSDASLKLAVLSMFLPEDAIRLTKRFKLSNEKRMLLSKTLSLYPKISRDMSVQEAKVALYLMSEDVYRKRILYLWSRSGETPIDKSWKAHFALPDKWDVPVFPIKGKDLLTLGYPKGPLTGQTLRILERFWIHSDFKLSKNKLMQIACKELHSNST